MLAANQLFASMSHFTLLTAGLDNYRISCDPGIHCCASGTGEENRYVECCTNYITRNSRSRRGILLAQQMNVPMAGGMFNKSIK